MAGRFGQGDLFAGCVAAAELVLLVFALGVSPWLAIPLAGATYAGVALLRPRLESRRNEPIEDTSPEQVAYQAALSNAAEIHALGGRIAKPAVREHVGRIADQTDRVLAVMREDGNLAAAPLFNDQLLVPYKALLTEYVRLTTRGIKSAGAQLARTETRDLPMIEQAVGAFYEKLHRSHVIDLAALSDVLEFNLESIAVPMPRRVTP